jgi:hypothetical protein
MKILTQHGSSALGLALAGAITCIACGGASASSVEPASANASASAKSGMAVDTASVTSGGLMDPKNICAKASPVGMSTSGGGDPALDIPAKASALSAASGEARSELQAKDNPYTLADLQALASRSSWEELLGHAEDVPPAQRTAVWDNLVETAATGYVTNLGTQTDSYDAVFASQALLRRFPRLSSSTGFMTKRGEAGKAAAAVCLERASVGQHCIDGMKSFLEGANTGADVGFAFGKIARKNQNAYVAVPFFDWSLNKKTDAASCSDEDLQLAVIAGLGLPPDQTNASGARHIAVGGCWEKLHPAISQGLQDSSATSYYRDNACAVLKQKGAL